ncbi:MAG: carboxypeptidase-like regulatory domain-containing protein, partial [Thermoanaerobaculia bacterium]|nr:carboxypeptidase-like regulatory domain-containing protein [Thermoanaerobaculia bacterium]
MRDSAEVVLDVDFRDETGQPVDVEAAWRLDEPFWQGSWLPSGVRRFDRLPPGESVSLCAAIGNGAFEAVEVRIPLNVKMHSVTARLRTAKAAPVGTQAWVSGVLVAEGDGSTIPAAELLAFAVSDRREVAKALAGRKLQEAPVASVVSDEAGAFRLGPVPAGVELTLVVKLPRGGAAIVGPVSVPEGRRETDVGVLQVPGERVLRGRVLDPDGRGVAGAQVSVAVDSGAKGWSGIRGEALPARSAEDGAFELRGLPSDVDLRVFAEAEGWEGGTTQVAPDDDEVAIELGRAQSIVGTVLGVDGGPISGARIWVHLTPGPEDADGDPARRDLLRPPPGLSDAAGRFELRGVSCRPANLRVTA